MLYIFYLLFPFLISAQEEAVLITYKVIYNTEFPTTKNECLYVSNNQKKTVYFIESVDKTDKKNTSKSIKENEYGGLGVTITVDSGQKRFNYFDYENNTLITQDDIFRESKLIKEKIPVLDWKLLEDTKSIDGKITLNKAVCYFRGWNYVAWFAPEIPVSYGPWKFHGLPGLILEVYDVEKKALHSVVKKIKFKDSIKVSPDNLPLDKTINIADYLKKKKENSMELRKKHLSRLPKGSISVNLDECEQCPKFKKLENFDLR